MHRIIAVIVVLGAAGIVSAFAASPSILSQKREQRHKYKHVKIR